MSLDSQKTTAVLEQPTINSLNYTVPLSLQDPVYFYHFAVTID